jgi:hypothetical protein
MTGSESLHVCLDLAPGSHPVRGRLRLHGQPEQRFAGWTELFAALEASLQKSLPGEEEGESNEG